MNETIRISNIIFTAADEETTRSGLIGWVRVTLNDMLSLDGVALRKTATGRLALSFPTRTDGHGQRHALVRPIDTAARQAIEGAVFQALGIEESDR